MNTSLFNEYCKGIIFRGFCGFRPFLRKSAKFNPAKTLNHNVKLSLRENFWKSVLSAKFFTFFLQVLNLKLTQDMNFFVFFFTYLFIH